MIVMQHTRLSVFLVCSGLPSIRMILVYHYHCLVTFLSRLLSVFFCFYIFFSKRDIVAMSDDDDDLVKIIDQADKEG